MGITIRDLELRDLSTVIQLMSEFAAFEDLSQYFEATEARLAAAMFDKGAVVEGLLATDGETPVGYALFYPNFASFRGQRGFYLEDLYISPDHRGSGVGAKMIKHIAEIGSERGYERIDFQVLDWNKSAIGFYERLGAHRDNEERHFKLTDDAYRKLAP